MLFKGLKMRPSFFGYFSLPLELLSISMLMQLFFQEEMSQAQFELNAEESKHLTKVLRKSTGDIVHFTDGQGGCYTCRIEEAHPKKSRLRVLEKVQIDRESYYIHLAIAPTKNQERLEWMVEKVTEIGCHEITFLNTVHTEKAFLKLDRLEKKIVAACKQSLKSWKPKLNGQIDFKSFITSKDIKDCQKFIAYVDHENRSLAAQAAKDASYVILIGPEGDFSKEEIEEASAHGFSSCSLGKSRLRTETAGMVAVHTLNFINE